MPYWIKSIFCLTFSGAATACLRLYPSVTPSFAGDKLALYGGAGAEARAYFFVQDAVIAELGCALWSGSLWKFTGIHEAGVSLVSERNGDGVGDAQLRQAGVCVYEKWRRAARDD